MAVNDERARTDDVRIGDLLAPLAGKGGWIRRMTVIVAGIVLIVGAAAYVLQPVRRAVTVGFRPVFQGIDQHQYPNGTPFSTTDVVGASILDGVYGANKIEDYCSAESFRTGFTVYESSPDLYLLDAEFQARLTDPRLTSVERQTVLAEYERQRSSLRRIYELRFIPTGDCSDIPDAVAAKVATDTLELWAKESVEKRGVLRVLVSIISPSLIEEAGKGVSNLLVRADMVRRATRRVIENIRAVEQIPGSETVRGSDQNVSFLEVRVGLEDLVQARLDPLVLRAGRLEGAGAQNWIQQAVRTATIEYETAALRADAYRTAFREYSGGIATPGTDELRTPQRPNDLQPLTTQIDRTFIDRIVDMSEVNVKFRQELTKDVLGAAEEAVRRRAVMEQYRQLQIAAGAGPVADSTAGDLETTLTALAAEATSAAKRFNEIYQVFSDVTLRPGPAMYQIDRPAGVTSLHDLEFGNVLLFVVGALLLTPLLLALGLVIVYHARRLMPARSGAATG